jgi:hypothetical protein
MAGRSSVFGTLRRGCVLLVIPALTAAMSAVVAQPASAAPTCTPGVCSPTNINFEQPGSYNIADVHVCGIEGNYAPLGSAEINSYYDEPYCLGSTAEGNYPDSQAIQFNPATSLVSGNTVTVNLPHPAEPYANSGSKLPDAQLPTYAPYEQTNSSFSASAPFSLGTNKPEAAFVDVYLAGYGAGQTVRLDDFNPYQPPALKYAPGPGVNGDNTSVGINGYDSNNGQYDSGQTTVTRAGGVAQFYVTDTAAEDVVLTATDTTSGVGIAQTAHLSFNGGTPVAQQTGQYCSNAQLNSPDSTATDGLGFTYLLIENNNNIGYLVPSVAVSSASGVESATLTMPPGVPTATAGTPVTLVVLDAVSPPGQGTPAHSLPSPYPPDNFSVATTKDPVPGYPTNAPTFQADAWNATNTYPYYIDEGTSTLTSSATTAQVGTSSSLTATATLNDSFNNPVNNKQVSIYQATGSHAAITPQTPTHRHRVSRHRQRRDRRQPSASDHGADGGAGQPEQVSYLIGGQRVRLDLGLAVRGEQLSLGCRERAARTSRSSASRRSSTALMTPVAVGCTAASRAVPVMTLTHPRGSP